MQRNSLWFVLGIALCGCNPSSFMGGEIPPGGFTGVPVLALFERVRNDREEPVWVRVTFVAPAPSQSGNVVARLGPGASTDFIHPQASIVNDADYSVSIEFYRDAALTQLIERDERKFRFSDGQVATFEEFDKNAR